jgi:hypothetical protein
MIAAVGVAAEVNAESFVEKLLRVAGLTASPAEMRGPGDDTTTGNIWIADIGRRTARAVTSDGGYRSPVFSPADGSLYALRAGAIVRIRDGSGAAPVQKVEGAIKLVGFDGGKTDEIIVLREEKTAAAPLYVISLKNGSSVPLAYDPKSEKDRRMLAQIRGQYRVYGEIHVYTKTESKQGLSRMVEWNDVYVRRGDGAPQNISGCDGASCVQPSLSPDGRTVAFIKTGG